jgi:conjugative relaxase-like TrwC/TraI family protein
MMTIAPVRSVSHAVTYFERGDHADYYLSEDTCPSRWCGTGASILGIEHQQVSSERFRRYLTGEIAGQRLGCMRNDEWLHRPAYDLTFNANKYVSIVALVGDDDRVIAAHDHAVQTALDWLENNATLTRVHSRQPDGSDSYEHVKTGNLLAGVFLHSTNRMQNCHLHSHAVLMNATRRKEDGRWRSIDSRHFYALQKEAGFRYRQALASSLTSLGYELTMSGSDNFEILGVPLSLVNALSERRDQIDQRLAQSGHTRETASPALKEKIAHQGRKPKADVDSALLQARWRTVASEHNFDAALFTRSAMDRAEDPVRRELQEVQRREQLNHLVDVAISSICERTAVFSRIALSESLSRASLALGVTYAHIDDAINWAIDDGRLIPGRTTEYFSTQFRRWETVEAFTTPENLIYESRLLAVLSRGIKPYGNWLSNSDALKIISSMDASNSQSICDGWTECQRKALHGVLTNECALTGIQGDAGTGKTTTVLKVAASELVKRGYTVVGMAPSASACQSLADGAELEHVLTVALHLARGKSRSQLSTPGGKQAWIVDETSLIATNDLAALLEMADRVSAKVILVGDEKQLGSVGAGAAFRQLQENGLPTFQLNEIVRQTNKHLLDSVYSAIDGDAVAAMAKLDQGGGKVIEVAGSSAERHCAIVEAYMKLTQAERDLTLIIDPSRQGRNDLNGAIHDALRLSKCISDQEVNIRRLEHHDMPNAVLSELSSYKLGDVIRFSRGYKRNSIEKHSHWRIRDIDSRCGVATIEDEQGRLVNWNPSSWGAKVQVYRPEHSVVSVGEQIRWLVNDKALGVINGSKGVVSAIDLERSEATIAFRTGQQVVVDLDNYKTQHWTYDYVSTVHASQGLTAERVIYHAESFRTHLASQKALYVAISRARQDTMIFTDDRQQLIERLNGYTGEKQNALDRDTHDLGIEMA